jgi:hypothetical protein
MYYHDKYGICKKNDDVILELHYSTVLYFRV